MNTLLTKVIAALILVGALAGCAEFAGKTDETALQQLDHLRVISPE